MDEASDEVQSKAENIPATKVEDENLDTASLTKDDEDLQPDNTLDIPDESALDTAIRRHLRPDTVQGLTKKIIRMKVAQDMNLQPDQVESIKCTVSLLIDRILDEFNDTRELPKVKSERQAEATSKRTKRRRASESDSNYDSANNSESAEDSPKASKKVGLRKAQSAAMTRQYFLENAVSYKSNLGPIEFDLLPREYSTGSCGWFFGAKKELTVGDKTVMCQVTVNCTVLGSKSWKKGKPAPSEAKED